MFPYIVFCFDNISLGDSTMDVITCVFNVWDKSESYHVADSIADVLEKSFDNLNSPNESILPTFYKEARQYIPDEDYEIKHVELKCLLRNIERS